MGCAPASWPEGVTVGQEPEQHLYDKPSWPTEYMDARITPVGTISLSARVLGFKRYKNTETSDILPVDLALGWGPMSDSALLNRLEIWQGQRRYYYKWQAGQLDKGDIKTVATHSANMHLIPATAEVWDVMKTLRPNDAIALEGELVDIKLPKGGTLRTSTSRTDTWDGACEIIWVTKLRVVSQDRG